MEEQLKTHVSIQRGFSTPPLHRCWSCCAAARFHCPFCSPQSFRPAKSRAAVKEHLENHLKQAFHIGEYLVHRCGLGCRAQPHYHCLYCLTTLTTKVNLTNHIPACIRAQQDRGQELLRAVLRRRRQTAAEGGGASLDQDGDDVTSGPQSDPPPVCGSRRTQTVQTDLDKPQDCDEFYFMTLVKLFKRLSPHKKTGVRMAMERILFEAAFQ